MNIRWRPYGSTLTRVGLAYLGLQAAMVGVWALFFPRSFFDDFPGVGEALISSLPPFNEHLIRDVGGLYLGFGILFLWAAMNMERELARPVLIAWLPFAAMHLWFHFGHLDDLGTAASVLQTVSLVLALAVPILLLYVNRSGRRTGPHF